MGFRLPDVYGAYIVRDLPDAEFEFRISVL